MKTDSTKTCYRITCWICALQATSKSSHRPMVRIQQQMSPTWPTCCSDFQTKPCHIGCALHSSTFTTHLNHLNVQDVDGVLNRYIQGTPELDPKLLRNLRRTVDNTNAVTRQWIIRLGTETLLLFLNDCLVFEMNVGIIAVNFVAVKLFWIAKAEIEAYLRCTCRWGNKKCGCASKCLQKHLKMPSSSHQVKWYYAKHMICDCHRAGDQIKYSSYDDYSPHLCVGFLLFVVHFRPPPACSVRPPSAAVRATNFVTRTTLPQHNSLTHNFITWHRRYFCVAGVAPTAHTAWQAWHLVTSTSLLCGRHCTYGAGPGLAGRITQLFHNTFTHTALSHIHNSFTHQHSHTHTILSVIIHSSFTQPCHAQLFHTQLFHAQHFHRHHFHTHTQLFHTQTWNTHTHAQNNLCEFWCGMQRTCKNTNNKLTRRMKLYIYNYIKTYNHSRHWPYKTTAMKYMFPPAASYMRPGAGLYMYI